MPINPHSKNILKTILLNLALAIVYAVTAKLGQSLSGSTHQITLIWPPSGIALGAILLWGHKVVPGVFFGAILSRYVPGEIPILSTYIALGNTLGAALAGFLLSKSGFGKRLSSAKQVFFFIAIGAMFAPAISATLGSASLVMGGAGEWSGYWTVWTTWWLGDMLGILLFTPLMLAWWSKRITGSRHQILESSFISLLIAASSLLVFFPQYHIITKYPVEYLIFPLLIWGVFRFGQRGTTLSTLLIAIIAVMATSLGYGPFTVSPDLQTNLISLEFFIIVLSTTSILVSSVIEEKLTAVREKGYEEKKFRALIENSRDVFTLVDQNANILYTSPSLTKVLGYTTEEVLGKFIFQYVDPQDRDRLISLFSEVAKVPGKTVTTEFKMVSKGGVLKWAEGTGANLLHEPGVGAVVISYRDIDEQKRLDLVKTEFVTLASHQLRAPLTTMKWYTEALREHSKKDPKSAQYLDAIYLSILKMNEFANLMLDVSRVELGNFITKKDEIDIKTIIESVVHELDIVAKQREITLSTNYKQPLPLFIANPKILHVVIQNLLDNAIRYTLPKGKVTIRAAVVDHHLHLEVKDTGIGIPQDEQAKTFDKLFRASSGKKVSPDGTGLGLYLVKTLLEREKGKVWFDSAEGEGTTFYVQLPIKLPKRS